MCVSGRIVVRAKKHAAVIVSAGSHPVSAASIEPDVMAFNSASVCARECVYVFVCRAAIVVHGVMCVSGVFVRCRSRVRCVHARAVLACDDDAEQILLINLLLLWLMG